MYQHIVMYHLWHANQRKPTYHFHEYFAYYYTKLMEA